jgi:hypothetical protein
VNAIELRCEVQHKSFTSNQLLMMERSVSGVQSIICIHCKKKNDSAFKCPSIWLVRFSSILTRASVAASWTLRALKVG